MNTISDVSVPLQATSSSIVKETASLTPLEMQLNEVRAALLQACHEPSPFTEEEEIETALLQTYGQIFENIKGPTSLCVKWAGPQTSSQERFLRALAHVEKVSFGNEGAQLFLAPNNFYPEMKAVFEATEGLLSNKPFPKEQHPFHPYLEKGIFVVTLVSGPSIAEMTEILLGKYQPRFERAPLGSEKTFNNAETFLRCLEIYKTHLQSALETEIYYSQPHIPLPKFCQGYVKQFPELASLSGEQLEPFVRLLSVFLVCHHIVECYFTIKMSRASVNQRPLPSFRPILSWLPKINEGSSTNELSDYQSDLSKQIQNLNGSDLMMLYLKEADGIAQFNALSDLLKRKHITMLDLGGGRGETHAVPKALVEEGLSIKLVNIEPHLPFKEEYIQAHHSIGLKDVAVIQRKAQEVSVHEVTHAFGCEKVDFIFASHFFYFLLADMHKATLTDAPLYDHPLYKYFELLDEKGVMLVTMQSGAGTRLYRNAFLGDHGLNPAASHQANEMDLLLKSFGNIASFLRYMEHFIKHYEAHTSKTIQIKLHGSTAKVPLDRFTIHKDEPSGGFYLKHPEGKEEDPKWTSPTLLNFYGNWKELQQEALKTEPLTADEKKKRVAAQKTQEVFLQILPVFAPANTYMLHPNITLEIKMVRK